MTFLGGGRKFQRNPLLHNLLSWDFYISQEEKLVRNSGFNQFAFDESDEDQYLHATAIKLGNC